MDPRTYRRLCHRCDTFKSDLGHVDRAILEGATDGFVKVCVTVQQRHGMTHHDAVDRAILEGATDGFVKVCATVSNNDTAL